MLTKVKLRRLQRGLRQWDVARQVGIGESHLSKIETGRVQPPSELLEKIATVLDVAPEDLVEERAVGDGYPTGDDGET